jgi:hypothetical protein
MAIGGYFELELPVVKEYHQNAIKLNTGRNAFEYILRAKTYKKVYLPYYICGTLFEPIAKLKLDHEFYHINDTFMPVFNFSKIKSNEVFLYINYFGICNSQVKEVSGKCKNIVVDNSQAFYTNAQDNVDTFYSPRKFFGVPDGAYLYTNIELNQELQHDVSYERMQHLLGRIEFGAEEYYTKFKTNNELLSGQPIKKMSNLTHRLLESINYVDASRKRRKNFIYLHENLRKTNQLHIDIDSEAVPMVYPFLINNGSQLKDELINRKIFVATYWPNVLLLAPKGSFEYNVAYNLIPLQIDQRYSKNDMRQILKYLNV